ncbi:OmpA family protein [Xanthocytophaga agilis]|uniref:OmpA family protein n=1 Tax=Xanthocytophaga agilis TaxID=3048010 RepID=A0AAE3QWN5_9BACT|nr:OmpA family protein [Xanthocytophaga agilis]MDJ1499356.1 OmpA family protein [Xanthocytophaga agilis]
MKNQYSLKLTSLLFLLSFLGFQAFAQSAKSLVKKGDKALDKENYHKALEYYKQANTSNGENADAYFGLGVTNLLLFNNKESLDYLRKARELDPDVDKHYYYWLGRAFHANLQFDSAVASYRVYLNDEIGKNDSRQDAVKTLILQAEFGKTYLSSPVDYQIVNLGTEVNSEYSEHSPMLTKDKQTLYFTSRRPANPSEITPRGDGWENIYTTSGKGSHWSGASLLTGQVNERKTHTSNVQLYDNDEKMLVYKSSKFGSLYESVLNGGTWSKPKPFAKFTNTQKFEPDGFVIKDGSVVYFASSLDNKNGNLDLWISRRKEEDTTKWSEPERLPSIVNTDADEDAPFLSEDGLTLFFSSRGHDSMGGYDVYKTTYEPFTRTWSKPVNMGYPINTPGDDIYFMTDSTGKNGYITSNRQGTMGQEDIYMVKMYDDVVVKGQVVIKTTKRPLGDYILNFDSQRKLGVKGSALSGADGNYSLKLRSGHTYTVEVRKQNGEVVLTDDVEIPMAEGEGAEIVKNFEIDIPDTIRTAAGQRIVLQNLNLVRVKYVETDSLLINGEVRDNAGILAGVLVEIREESSNKPFLSTKTDANGVYHFGFIPGKQTNYVIEITQKNYFPYLVVLNYPSPGNTNKFVTDQDLTSVALNQVDVRSVLTYAFPIDIKEGAKAVLGGVYFDFNSADLRPESNFALDKLYEFLKRNPRIIMEIGGHTDNLGTAYVNKFLSQKRAQAVVNYLIKKGIDKKRLTAVGYGFTQPITTNDHELNGRDVNRRVEVKILRK